MTIGTVTEKKQPDNKYVEGDEVIRIKELRVHLSFEFQVGDSNQNTKLTRAFKSDLPCCAVMYLSNRTVLFQ